MAKIRTSRILITVIPSALRVSAKISSLPSIYSMWIVEIWLSKCWSGRLRCLKCVLHRNVVRNWFVHHRTSRLGFQEVRFIIIYRWMMYRCIYFSVNRVMNDGVLCQHFKDLQLLFQINAYMQKNNHKWRKKQHQNTMNNKILEKYTDEVYKEI